MEEPFSIPKRKTETDSQTSEFTAAPERSGEMELE